MKSKEVLMIILHIETHLQKEKRRRKVRLLKFECVFGTRISLCCVCVCVCVCLTNTYKGGLNFE